MADRARGTRGLVTTLEDSTGSVGDSSAPSRNDSVQRGRSARARPRATIAAVIGIASTSLRSGRCHCALQHLALDLEPVAEQDHDRARRSPAPATNPTRRRSRSTPSAAVAEREPGEHEQGGQRQEAAPRHPGRAARRHEQRPEHRDAVSVEVIRGTVSTTFEAGNERSGCTSRCSASRRPGRTPTAPAVATWSRRTAHACSLDCGNGVFSKLRRHRDYIDIDAVVISHLHADHFLDLVPFAYALTLRAAPAAGAGRPLAGHRLPGAPAPVRAARRARDVPPHRRRVGQRGPHRERLRADRVRPGRRARGRRSRIALPRGPALHADVRRRISLDQRRRALHLRRRLRARTTSSSRSPRGADLLLIEATLPRPERDGRARAPHAGRGRRARPRAPASGASSSPTSPTSSTSCGRARRPSGLRRAGRARRHEGAVYKV